MRPPGSKRPIIFGFILAISTTLALPYLALGAAQSFGGLGGFRASRMQEQSSYVFQIIGADGFLGGPVIITQQFQPAPTTEPTEPAKKGIYVEPRWVDGGYGVQVLQPGYWTDAKQRKSVDR
jgi:hypothetical protein